MLSRAASPRRPRCGRTGQRREPCARRDPCGSRPVQTTPGSEPSGLPERQFAWTETLAKDTYGNPVAPMYDRLLFFDVRAGPPQPPRARWRRRCGRSSGRSRGGPTACCSPSRGGRTTSRTCSVSHHRSRTQRSSRPSRRRSSTAMTCACTSRSDDEQRLEAIEAALVQGSALPAHTARCPITGPLRWRRHELGSSGRVYPPSSSTSPASQRATPFQRLAAVHGLQIRADQKPGERGRRHDPGRPVRRRHDHARQLHAPHLQFWYDRNTDLQTRAGNVRRASHPGRDPRDHDRAHPPTPTKSSRRSSTTA